MTFEEAPPEILATQVSVPVRFYSFDGALTSGEIIIHRDLETDAADLFTFILRKKFPITSVIPISVPQFHGDDELSMRANNTSGFNYRAITGADRLSNHAFGRAIDINPLLNPYIRGGVVRPDGAVYDTARLGTITADSFITAFLKERGWQWGGEWTSLKDYQHFEKPEMQQAGKN